MQILLISFTSIVTTDQHNSATTYTNIKSLPLFEYIICCGSTKILCWVNVYLAVKIKGLCEAN